MRCNAGLQNQASRVECCQARDSALSRFSRLSTPTLCTEFLESGADTFSQTVLVKTDSSCSSAADHTSYANRFLHQSTGVKTRRLIPSSSSEGGSGTIV